MTDLTVQKAHTNFGKIVVLVRDISKRWVVVGQLLWENREKEYWKTLGHESFNSFLAMPDIGLSQTTLYKFLHLYELYCLKLGFAPEELNDISYERLEIIKNKIQIKDKKDWLVKAKTLSQSDLLIEIKEEDTNKGFKTKKDYPHIYRHSECGKWVIDIDVSETCICSLKKAGV